MFIILQLIAAQVGMFTDNIIERFFRDRLQYRMHNNRSTFGIFGCKRLTSIVNHGVKKDWWTHSAVLRVPFAGWRHRRLVGYGAHDGAASSGQQHD